MKFETIIPYHKGNLGKAYNEAMQKVDGWALLLDHDVMILTPGWQDICELVIDQLGTQYGWITCRTNSIWCDDQLDRNAPQSSDIMEHLKYAKMIAQGNIEIKEPESKARKFLGNVFSGFFILTHKQAWTGAGGFIERRESVIHEGIRFDCNLFLGVDNDYFFRLKKAGYKMVIMNNVYAFHLREIKRNA